MNDNMRWLIVPMGEIGGRPCICIYAERFGLVLQCRDDKGFWADVQITTAPSTDRAR